MTTVLGRVLATLAATAALVSLALVAGPSAARPTCALADGDFHVALVITHGDRGGHTHCVAFNAATPTFDAGRRSISGEEVLALGGVRFQAVDFGGSLGRAVCQVDSEPSAPAGGFTTRNCFGNPYWVLWRASNGGWISAASGVTNQRFADGDAEGLSFGDSPSPGPAGLCPGAQPWPTPLVSSPPTGGPPVGAGPDPGRASTIPGVPVGAGREPTAGPATAATPSSSASPGSASSSARQSPGARGPRPGSSGSGLGLLSAVAAAFVGAHDTASATLAGWVAAIAAVSSLTGLLLARAWLTRRKT